LVDGKINSKLELIVKQRKSRLKAGILDLLLQNQIDSSKIEL